MKRGSISEILKKKDGVALVTVMVVFLTLVIVVVAATMMAHSNFLRTQKTTNLSSAYYVAESGLNETIDDFKAYYESLSTPKSGLEIESEFKNLITMEDDSKRIEYGNVMNQEAWADTAFSYEGTDGDIMLFRLASNGHLGDTSRSVETFIRLRVATDPTESTDGTYYQPDAMLAINTSGISTPFNLSGSGNLTGPLITNNPIYFTNAINSKGPIVTNNVIELTANDMFTGIGNPQTMSSIITSSTIKITANWGLQKIPVLMIKPGGNINFVVNANNGLLIEYLFLPHGTSVESIFSGYFKNGNNLNYTIGKVIYYNPVNFDPYTNPVVDGVNVEHLFGKDPILFENTTSFDYRDYFKDDFILDNMDKVEMHIPKVVLPTRPIYGEIDPLLTTITPITVAGSSNNQYEIVDANLNYKTSNVWNKPSVFPINPGLFSSYTKFKYNSMYLQGGHGADNPTRIDIGDKNIEIVTKSLHIDRFIEIIGTGTLRIYVVGDGTNISSSNLNISPVMIQTKDTVGGAYTNDASKLQIVVYESGTNGNGLTVTPASGSSLGVYAAIFSQNLNLNVGGSARYYGTFVSAEGKSVSISGGSSGASQLIFAPKAKISLSGGTKLQGVIVGESFSLVGNNEIIFDTEFDKSLVETILPEFITVDNGSGGETGGTPGSPGSVGEFTISPIREVD